MDLDLTPFTDSQIGALLNAYAKLAADDGTLPWLARFGESMCATVGNEQSRRRLVLHTMEAEVDSGVFLASCRLRPI